MPERQCPRCGTIYRGKLADFAFRVTRHATNTEYRSPICRCCVQDEEDEQKTSDRWPQKIRDTTRRHVDRLKKQPDKPGTWWDPNLTKTDLIDTYGWDQNQMAHRAAHEYANGCSYCFEPYEHMGHGLGDITLDIIDRSKPPHYRTNTRWCCNTCNRLKATLSPEDWELYLFMWRVRKGQQNRPAEQKGMLFDF